MDLSRLLAPRSIAILGATERPSIARCIIESLAALDFKGALYPVNSKYDAVLGVECFGGLGELPARPDVVAICIRPTLQVIAEVAAAGAGAAVVYGSFGSSDEAEDRARALCIEAGIQLCGPNCMGVINPHHGSSTYYGTLTDPGLAGGVGWISQSGSIANSMLADVRRFGFSAVISSGNELVLDTAAYIEHLVEDPNTKIIATFTESVRDGERYVAALDRAYEAGKPVVVLKAGRSRRAQRAVATHTGGIAGESRIFSAVLRDHKAIEVEDLDAMAEVLAVLHGKHWPQGRRIGIVTDSGGKTELILDLIDGRRMELPPLPAQAQDEVRSLVGALIGDGNPLDAWGNGDWEHTLPAAVGLMASQDCYDAIAYCTDARDGQPLGDQQSLRDDCELFAAAAASCGKPAYLLNSRAGRICKTQVDALKSHGIPQLSGVRQGFAAIAAVASHRTPRPPKRAAATFQTAAALFGKGGRCLNEVDAKRILQAAGLPVVGERCVRSAGEAKTAAGLLGYPVVLKATADDLPHKSDHGLVALDLADDGELDKAWLALQANVAALDAPENLQFVVQKYVPNGVEFFLGVVNDAQFGLMLALGIGGLDIEDDPDFATRPLPLRLGDAEDMLSEVRGARQLDAARGRTAGDRRALVDCTYRLADFAAACRPRIRGLDINPIKVLPHGQGCVIVDAVIFT